MSDPSSGQSSSDSQQRSPAMEFLCPYCGKSPDSTEQWIRTGSTERAANPTVQLLFDDKFDIDSESTISEQMTLLHPCGHSFRYDDLRAVREPLHLLDDLKQRYEAATSAYERQQFREEIHRIGLKLDAAIERCETHMDATRPG